MRHKPTEIRAIEALLEAEADSVHELAIEILDKLHVLRTERALKQPPLVIWVYDPGVCVSLWGPYDTVKQAEKDIGVSVIAASPKAFGQIVPLNTRVRNSEETIF